MTEAGSEPPGDGERSRVLAIGKEEGGKKSRGSTVLYNGRLPKILIEALVGRDASGLQTRKHNR